ncbi:DUF3772 domain-containing protein [Fodinicurvata sediminis]|uniref:DUF3772 domain-containing protein n=1 Tax=Fodinicurvata sediminis TaxID=1121832 RepID=UPI0003B60E59|nr:DUF3772 domain-containing protein [Fodinicurvata sediminis]
MRTGFLLSLFLTLFLTLAAAAQGPGGEPAFDSQMNRWESVLQEAERKLRQQGDISPEEEEALKSKLREILSESETRQNEAESRLSPLEDQLESLGEPPGEDAPPENPEIQQTRSDLNERISTIRARVRQAALVRVRSNEFLQEIASRERQRLQEEVLARTPSPIWPGVWQQAGQDTVAFLSRMAAAPVDWAEETAKIGTRGILPWIYLFGISLLAFLVGWPIRYWLNRRFGRDPEEEDPGYSRRIVATVSDGVARAIFPALAIAIAFTILYLQQVLTGYFATLLYILATAVTGFILVTGLARAALSPRRPAWRIMPVTALGAQVLYNRIFLIAAIFAATAALQTAAIEAEALTPAMRSTLVLLDNTVIAILLLSLTPNRYWTNPEEGFGSSSWNAGRILLIIIISSTPFLALAGYSRLAEFLQTRIIVTGVLIGLVLLLRLVFREALAHLLRLAHRRRSDEPEDETRHQLTLFWVGLVIDLLLILPTLYLLLLVYGVPSTIVTLWAEQLLTGLKIGEVTISLVDILFAIMVLAIGLFASGLIRRWLSEKVLPNTYLDYGIRNSISAGISYIGVALALILAIATLGISLSNLALVAGALSVGIGFGLRTVVENFVAGLLLLIERPIKVGDWVVVGPNEGMVRHISVRSTEIETFDRSSVIVPNSDLIASPVTNWTHKNRIARLIIPLRVAYGENTRKVHQLLLDCASQHDDVLAFPEPYVYFKAFGESALEFELRCYIRETDRYLDVMTDLHFAIDESFRENSIQMPFPQQDIHLHRGPSHERRHGKATDSSEEKGPEDPGQQQARQHRGEISTEAEGADRGSDAD